LKRESSGGRCPFLGRRFDQGTQVKDATYLERERDSKGELSARPTTLKKEKYEGDTLQLKKKRRSCCRKKQLSRKTTTKGESAEKRV